MAELSQSFEEIYVARKRTCWPHFQTPGRELKMRRGVTGSPSSLNEPHKEHNVASNYKDLYGIFYKISMKVVKGENIFLYEEKTKIPKTRLNQVKSVK